MTQPDLPDWISTVSVADSPQLLTFSFNDTLPHVFSTQDVSPYQSVILQISSKSANINNVLTVLFEWFIGIQLVNSQTFTMWGSQTASVQSAVAYINAPCLGQNLRVTVTSNGAGDTILANLIGSRRAIPGTIIKCDTQNVGPALIAYGPTSLAAGATQTFRVGPSHGPLSYSVTLGGVNNLNIAFAEINNSGIIIEPRIVSVTFTNNDQNVPVYAPGCAIRWTVQNVTGAAANLTMLVLPIA